MNLTDCLQLGEVPDPFTNLKSVISIVSENLHSGGAHQRLIN